MTKINFKGPLFIVGMPRSGTKLLVGLLNQHPEINIPPAESRFIPAMVAKFGNTPSFDNADEFERFYQAYTETTFYWYMKRLNIILTKESLEKQIQKKSWSSIFKTILKYNVLSTKNNDAIWGDKSPYYLTKMKLLNEIFENARFLHILRDPRDCCLSRKKAWGANIYSTATGWRNCIEIARSDAIDLKERYKEIYYESLLNETKKTLEDICRFLEIDYSNRMTYLDRSCEPLGDAKGVKAVMKNNTNKYKNELSNNEIKKIEEIVFPTMCNTIYKFEYAQTFIPMNKIKLKFYKKLDRWNRLLFDIKTKGLKEGWNFYFKITK